MGAAAPLTAALRWCSSGRRTAGRLLNITALTARRCSLRSGAPLADSCDAGTFEVSDTIVTAHQLYSKDPRSQPQTWRWSFFLKGDTCIYHVLNDAGQATAKGVTVRVRAP